MDLLEYQAKELFSQMGIPVLPSQRIDRPTDLKGLKIPFPIVLKSQVYTGARGKVGGIRFVENTIDAIAAAQAIFHLSIMGKYPKVLLAEAKYNPDREFYLAVTLDSSTCRPVLLGSQSGGVEVEAHLADMQQVVVDQEFSPFYARRLALKMGLEGKLLCSVSTIIEKMYRLFVARDLDLVEINPLAVSADQNLMALDGKITVNDAALGRQPELAALIATIPNQTIASLSCGVNLVELEGNIGVMCSGAGLTMSTLDLLHKLKGKPANFVDLGSDYRHCCPPDVLQERLKQGLDVMTQEKGVKVVLVNILGGVISCLQVAEAIAGFLKWQPANRQIPLVVRLAGEQFQSARGLLAAMDVPVFESMDEAIAETIALTTSAPSTPSTDIKGKQQSLLLASA